MIAHIAGLPVEELLPVIAAAGAVVTLARFRLAMRLRRPKQAAPRTPARLRLGDRRSDAFETVGDHHSVAVGGEGVEL